MVTTCAAPPTEAVVCCQTDEVPGTPTSAPRLPIRVFQRFSSSRFVRCSEAARASAPAIPSWRLPDRSTLTLYFTEVRDILSL